MKKTTTTLKNNVERIDFCIKALKNIDRSLEAKFKASQQILIKK